MADNVEAEGQRIRRLGTAFINYPEMRAAELRERADELEEREELKQKCAVCGFLREAHSDGTRAYCPDPRDTYFMDTTFVSARAVELERQATGESGDLLADALAALRECVASAHPNPIDHPAMTRAWSKARAILARATGGKP